jgi:16S rRNA (uracil1498-N3)-methyltransferase
MPARRFLIPQMPPSGETAWLDRADADHARRVLRLAEGDAVSLTDGAGHVADASIVCDGKRMGAKVESVHFIPPPEPRIDLAIAIPKGSRADVLIEKASELGADRLVPLITQRSVVNPRSTKLDRFERLAAGSAKQCGRAWLMRIDPPMSLDDLLADAAHELKLIGAAPRLDDVTGDVGSSMVGFNGFDTGRVIGVKRVLVLIGPEGGWTDDERHAARSAGCIGWQFAPHVLRIETAGLAALAVLRAAAYSHNNANAR